jgi:hypothetical protein
LARGGDGWGNEQAGGAAAFETGFEKQAKQAGKAEMGGKEAGEMRK